MIDVTQQINAVRRRVGSRTLEAGEARVVTVSQVYDAAIDDVWDACTNPERIPRWFLPVSGELRAGGRYQLTGNASGTIERCDRPHGFAASWEYGGQVSWIELRLKAEGDSRTRLELDHIMHVDDRWEKFGPGAVGIGWELGLNGLAIHMASGRAVDPEEAASWAASAEGKRFIELSSDRWAEADIAAGTADSAARSAAARTTAFYTGAAPEHSSGG